jgi:hypothetical protein
MRGFITQGVILALAVLAIGGSFIAYTRAPQETDEDVGALRVFNIEQGGTGTSTSPALNKLLIGNADGDYIFIDKSDLTGSVSGDGVSNWLYQFGRLSPSTTVGIAIFASSTIGGGTGATGLTVLGNSTTTGILVVQGTGTSTLAGDLKLTGANSHVMSHGIYALDSAGLHIHSSNGTEIAALGAGGGSNATFYGGLNIDGTTRLATALNGLALLTSGTVSAAVADTDYQVPLTFGDGLTRTVNDVDVDTTQNISTLSNLTSNGFVKTSGGTGALSVDTTTYESGLTAGDGLTRTANDFDFDGGATPAGDLGGTWASPSVTDDSHAHTGTTLSGIDISSDTNLTADGTEIILTGDALSLGTSLSFLYGSTTALSGTNLNFTFSSTSQASTTGLTASRAHLTNATSSISFFSALGTFTNTIVTTLATFLNVTITGLLDLGGGVLEIPNGSAPTVDSIGELALDSTSNQLVLYGTAKKVYGDGNIYRTFTYATSTTWTGTTTLPIGVAYVAETWNGVRCFTDVGTVNVDFGDGTNYMNATTSKALNPAPVHTLSSNNTFTAGETRYIRMGTAASSPTRLSCTASISLTSD